ncbi:class I SAM-dependent methyltransferase [Brevibacillus choshinensis]|uniref:class I SAM-dependent methyltransferase n=1 Tax=Brevibacillus choshinensis TaxID=54911 RepID=UPI002E246B30|nr:class I SAM-dependent methyltransferase [Brevibacillus choshinensis]MED4753925.1 class I SAM-dependent methyltransferase [Brevibacillus choshinensis]MED4779056.1 class I SAM-dependent methyltransferase [Brevibacillus choshinensis]
MQRFWEKIIGPIFKREQPKTVVEIGALRGEHTIKLLNYCHQDNASLIVIDPAPAFHERQWGDELGRRMILLRELSMDVLPRLGWMDAVLIDGDHNWYTVYHELKQVAAFATRTGSFPLVFLHDTEWPYGRRDYYFNPNAIPPQYRQPYARKGILQGRSEVLDEGGFNPGGLHAIREGGPRNGILTAIEDFLKETTLPISLHRVASHNGLAILTVTNQERDAFIEELIKNSGL